MAEQKSVRLHNRSDKADNIVMKEHEIIMKCEAIQKQLPNFMRSFCISERQCSSKNQALISKRYQVLLPVSYRRDRSYRSRYCQGYYSFGI